MAKLELTRELTLSPQEAWERASDFHSLSDWMTMHEGWRSELPDELTVGTTIVGVAGAKGLRNRVTWKVKSYDPPSFLEVTGNGVGGTRYGMKMKVTPTETGCTFTVTINLGGAPLFGPIGATAARAVKGDIDRSIQRFEELYGG
ncbi:SRPBCC family protein [Mycolicibacterium sp. XJ662]